MTIFINKGVDKLIKDKKISLDDIVTRTKDDISDIAAVCMSQLGGFDPEVKQDVEDMFNEVFAKIQQEVIKLLQK